MRFTQEEIEKELGDVVPHGTRKQIAIATGIYPGIVSAYFCSSNERKSPQFETLQMQSAMDNSDDPIEVEAGENHWQKMCILRQMSMPRRESGLCVDNEIARSQQESTDVVVSRLTGKSLYRQLIEVNEAAKAIERTRQAILDAIHEEKSTPNSGRTRVNGSGVINHGRKIA